MIRESKISVALFAILVILSGCSAWQAASTETQTSARELTNKPTEDTSRDITKSREIETTTQKSIELPPGISRSEISQDELISSHERQIEQKSFSFYHYSNTEFSSNSSIIYKVETDTLYDGKNLSVRSSASDLKYDTRLWSNSSVYVRDSEPTGTDSLAISQYGVGYTDEPALAEWTHRTRFNNAVRLGEFQIGKIENRDENTVIVLSSSRISSYKSELEMYDDAEFEYWNMSLIARQDGIILRADLHSRIQFPTHSEWLNRTYKFRNVSEDIDTRPAWVDEAIAQAPKLRAARADSGHHYALTNRGPRDIPSGTEVTVDFTEGGVLTTNLSRSLGADETVYVCVVADDGEVVLRSTRERPGPATGIRLGERAEIHLNRVVDGSEFFLGTAEVNGGDDGE